MPSGRETIARRQRMRAKDHLWLDTGGFSGGVLIDEYQNRFDRAFDTVAKYGKNVEDAPSWAQEEFRISRQIFEQRSPLSQRMRLDRSIYENNPEGAEGQIARETDDSIRVSRARAWFDIMERIERFRRNTKSPTILTMPGE